jgi:hypothetical protein
MLGSPAHDLQKLTPTLGELGLSVGSRVTIDGPPLPCICLACVVVVLVPVVIPDINSFSYPFSDHCFFLTRQNWKKKLVFMIRSSLPWLYLQQLGFGTQ